MSVEIDRLYAFVMKALLTEEALDVAGRKVSTKYRGVLDEARIERLGIDKIDEGFVEKSGRMSSVFIAITAFENSVRDFIEGKMFEEKGENWWDGLPDKIKNGAKVRLEEEKGIRWLSPRGSSPIYYLDFGDLIRIMIKDDHWPFFEPHLKEINWATHIFKTLERSRNIIMHGGILADTDIERVGMCIRDWINQVG